MIQNITITADTKINLKPLIEGALRSEIRLLELGIERTLGRVRAYEQQYGLPFAEFEHQFEAGLIDDDLDFVEWAGEIRTYRLLTAQQRALREANLS
jgi:hypothetical protein